MEMTREEFESVVGEALDRLPAPFADRLDNIVVQVREAPDLETLQSVGLDPRRQTLFGLYTGIPYEARGSFYGNALPDVVLLFRRPLLAACRSRRELIRQIQLTLLHELGHYFGFSDDDMAVWDEEFGGLD